jgi:hypothetical protein
VFSRLRANKSRFGVARVRYVKLLLNKISLRFYHYWSDRHCRSSVADRWCAIIDIHVKTRGTAPQPASPTCDELVRIKDDPPAIRHLRRRRSLFD